MRDRIEVKSRGGRSWVLAAGLLVALGVGSASRASAVDDRVTLRSQLGIIYAQNGQVDDARKEFVKLLEEPNGRAAALTNLGNLAVLEGNVDVALENYNQAAALDTVDGGILLDLGLALKSAGKDADADAAFSRALTKAGGKDRAAYLLGVKTDDGDTSKGKVTKLSSEEIKALLSKASARVPAANAAASGKDASRTPVVSRPGGARAADVSATPATLYWKEK
jgi:tetratricopeptide (TPR) repeat protein